MRIAPMLPDRQWRMMNDIGEVHDVRHTSFVRVSCQRPATTSVAADARRTGPITDPSRPSAESARSAATPNAPQTRKYGIKKSAVAALSARFVGRPPSSRVNSRKARIIGMADGSIIATIMARRRAKNRARFVDVGIDGAIRAMRKSADVHVAYQAAATTRTTAAATGIVTRRRSAVGSAGTASPIGRRERWCRYERADPMTSEPSEND